MTSEDRQLRRKLAGLRISQAHVRNALQVHKHGPLARQHRAKWKELGKATSALEKQLDKFERQKAAATQPFRSTQEVLGHHLAAFDSGNLKDALSDYAADAVLLTPEGEYRGHDQIGPVLQRLIDDVFSTCSDFKMLRQVVEGDVAYIVWSAESEKLSVPLATDTYLVRFGKIVVQTFTAEIKGRANGR